MLHRGKDQPRHQNGARPSSYLHTSPWAFALWWLGLLLLHSANVAYYVGVTLLYKIFPNTYLDFQLTTYKIGLPNTEHRKIATIHAVIAALHAFFIFLMVASSLHARRLVFQPEMRTIYRLLARTPYVGPLLNRVLRASWFKSLYKCCSKKTDPTSEPRRTSSASLSRRVSDAVGQTSNRLFSRDGVLGVDSEYFDHVLLVRELVETTLQSYQLYRMTHVLPRLWLIRFYVALLVANCWAVPILHRYYRDRETKRRMLCLLCDAVLDMVSSIGVSVVIFATYAPQYTDPHGLGFSFLAWFDDEWISNMQQEFQMMLVASWGDMVSRVVFALGLLQCMDAIKDMLTPVMTVGPSKQHVSSHPASCHANEIVPIRSTDDETRKKSKDNARDATTITGPSHSPKASWISRKVWFVVHVIGPGLFVMWGCGILVVHLVAESKYSETECALNLKPWFSTKPGCSLVEINCATLDSNGHDDAMEAAWETFDPDRAARVVIRHCPQLHVSPKIRKYHTMSGFKVYNSTIVAWEEAAAVTETDNPGLRSVLLLRTTVPNGELPVGLLSADFPKRMGSFYSSATNLKSLPSNLDFIWPLNMQLLFENSLFTDIPDVVVRLQPNMVSMAGSPISIVQPELIESPNLTVLQLGLTRVQELPPSVKRIHPSFTALFLQFTNVTVFPVYLNGYANFMVHFPSRLFNAFGSPYCRELDEIVAGNRSTFSSAALPEAGILMDASTPEKLAFVSRAVDCSGPGQLFFFPLPVEDITHQLSS